MYLLLEEPQDIVHHTTTCNSSDDINDATILVGDKEECLLLDVTSKTGCNSSSSSDNKEKDVKSIIQPSCAKKQRLLEEEEPPQEEERKKIRFVPPEENTFHEIPSRRELLLEQGVEWDVLFYQPDQLQEIKRRAYQEVKIVELLLGSGQEDEDDWTEDSFFHEIVEVDSKELERIRIFLQGSHELPSSASSLTCCLRGLEKKSSRYASSTTTTSSSSSSRNGTKTRKLRAKGLATVLMGQEKIQQQREREQQRQDACTSFWGKWRNPPATTTNATTTTAAVEEDLHKQMDVVAQLYMEVAKPSVEAAQQRAAYDELEAQAIHFSSARGYS